jgi:hypothetical protein
MQGEFDEARRLWGEARSNYDDLGLRLRRAARSLIPAEIEFLAGNPDEAVAILLWAYEGLREMGTTPLMSTVAAFLADASAAAGQRDEAIRYAKISAEHAAAEDIVTQVMWRVALARATNASALAAEAARLAAPTDYPDLKARALVALGEVSEARRIYEAKGNIAAVERLSAYARSS